MAALRAFRSVRAHELVALGSLLSVGGLVWVSGYRDAPPRSTAQQILVAESGCFDGDDLRKSWVMDDSAVHWNSDTGRFEDGTLVGGKRNGCWTVWYKNGVFDSDASGTYSNGAKVDSAPSPLGDFGSGDD
jgi:hypothetical protein